MLAKRDVGWAGLLGVSCFAAVTLLPAGWARAGVTLGRLPVPGKAAIFDAGQTIPTLDGLLAPVFELPATAPGQYLQIDSTANSVTYRTRWAGAEGFGDRTSTINPVNGISGILSPTFFFLAGVFLGDSPPEGPAPPTLDFHQIGTDFESLAPQLHQTFLIGDGLTGWGAGIPQRFIVPEGATRLFLGFADAPNFVGDPGAYGDNYGWLDVFFSIVEADLMGDLNADGFMGITDLNIVLSHWSQSVTPGDFLMGDPSGDGFVGIEDLNFVLGNWNAGTPPAGGAVPEPGAFVVASLAAAGLFSRRR